MQKCRRFSAEVVTLEAQKRVTVATLVTRVRVLKPFAARVLLDDGLRCNSSYPREGTETLPVSLKYTARASCNSSYPRKGTETLNRVYSALSTRLQQQLPT